ncbi:MAG: hypothetical protein E6944_26615, partial [Klebsiella michiganensis]|nr:hypothetical protein [Klebsiella michiganensis]
MSELTPPLGTAGFSVLKENVENLDIALNTESESWLDRGKRVNVSWKGILNKNAEALKETQDSITILGLPFTTLAEAQAAANDGKIPVGAVTWARNPSDSSLADEYINSAGTLTATGRHMPSQVYVDTQIAVVDKRLSDNDGPVDITDELDYIDKYVIYADGTVVTNGDGWRGLFINVRKGEQYTYKGSMGSVIPEDNIAVMWQLDSAGNKVAPLVSMVSTGVVQADQEYSAAATMDGLIYIRARSRDASGELTPFSVISNRPYYVPGKYFDRISGETSVTLGQITEGKFFRELGAEAAYYGNTFMYVDG